VPTDLINSADDQYLHELLNADSKIVYRVPPYQREYSWGKQQWDELYADIIDDPAEEGHFLGTIICVNQTKNATKEVILELIDGQQRMTTLSILLVVLYSELNARKADFRDDEERYLTFLSLKKQLVLGGVERLRPQHQGNNLADYRWLLHEAGLIEQAAKQNWYGIRRIARAHKFFLGELHAELQTMTPAEQLDHLFAVTDRVRKSIMVKLEVSTTASAFVLFESLNNRGMELSPIDLIKNTLLMRAENTDGVNMEHTYESWKEILANLGDSYTDQERFLRYYYNAFEPVKKENIAVPVATRSNLIKLYEEYIDQGIEPFLRELKQGSEEYGFLIGNTTDRDKRDSTLAKTLRSLSRAQGSPGYILLMYLMANRALLELTDLDLSATTKWLISFFVRRNLTGFPQTYALPRLFREIIHDVSELRGVELVDKVRRSLQGQSRSDEAFREALEGDIYSDNSDMTRFILTSLAEKSQTQEIFTDLWARTDDSKHYVWTIEHVFPQGDNIPADWVSMMGGPEPARTALATLVHKLGNLTLTGYNSTLGNKSFVHKRDRTNAANAFVGYKNGFSLNEELAQKDSWTAEDIQRRTKALVDATLQEFSFS